MTTQTTPPAQPRAPQPPSWLPLLALAAASACQAKDPAVDSATTTASATTASDSVSTTASASTSTSTPDPTTTHALTEATSSTTTTGGPGPGEECSMWVQDCPPGYKCAVYGKDGVLSPNAARCVPLPSDPKQAGEFCGGWSWGGEDLDDCDRGLICMDLGDGLYACRPTCIGDPPATSCPIDGWDCTYLFSNGVAGLCQLPCDPLTPECPGGQSCISVSDSPNQLDFWCAPEIAGLDPPPFDGFPCPCGVYCSYGACGVGRACISGLLLPDCGGNCCTSYCDVNAPNTCALAAQGAECVPFINSGFEVPPGMEHVGFCGLP